MIDLDNGWTWVIGGLLLISLLIGIFIHGMTVDAKKEAVFMDECRLYHKQYECVAMWRAGERDSVIITQPMFYGR